MKLLHILNESFVTKIGRKEIEVTLPDRARAKQWVLVPINTAVFDAKWPKDDYYIAQRGVGASTKGGAYEGMREWLKANNHMEAAEVQVDETGEVYFINGRHRYALLRDLRAKPIIVAMSKESVENAKQFGII